MPGGSGTLPCASSPPPFLSFLLSRYNVTSILIADRILATNQWNVTARSILFECPANSYKYLSGCRQCPTNSTSPPGSLEQTSCLCDPNFFLQVVGSDYICVHCPPNSRSVCGSTRIQDCKCDQGYTGEDGKTCSPCPLNTYKAVVSCQLRLCWNPR